MKMNRLCLVVVGASLSFAALLAPRRAAGSGIEGIGAWEGSGSGTDLEGKDLGKFTVALVRKTVAPGKIRADGKVTLDGGREIAFWQELEDRGAAGFRLISNNGAGGGNCFANGICTAYEEREGGHAFATTLVKDGADRVRILVTELEKGRAVRFFQQSLSRKP